MWVKRSNFLPSGEVDMQRHGIRRTNFDDRINKWT